MKKVLYAAICFLLLAVAFRYGHTPTEQPVSNQPQQEPLVQAAPAPAQAETPPETPAPAPQKTEPPADTSPPATPVPENSDPVCTISIRCDTILENTDLLDETKVSLVPENGMILAAASVSFSEGESVFDLLLRETRARKIHLDFENTPIYNTAYIKGIANLYERDCGDGSGWLYRVNGETPNHGCSQHLLQSGDVVEWIYTCRFGDNTN